MIRSSRMMTLWCNRNRATPNDRSEPDDEVVVKQEPTVNILTYCD